MTAEPCPTCQGRNRETTDMVCMTCGRDYMPDDGSDVSAPGLGWKRLMGLWREQAARAMGDREVVEAEMDRRVTELQAALERARAVAEDPDLNHSTFCPLIDDDGPCTCWISRLRAALDTATGPAASRTPAPGRTEPDTPTVCACGHLECLHIPRDGRCTGASCDCRALTEHAAGEAYRADNPHDAAPEFPPTPAVQGPSKPSGNSAPGVAYLQAVRAAWPDDDAVREYPDLAWAQIHELANRLAERIWPDVHHTFWPGVSATGATICRAPGCQRLENHYLHQTAEAGR
jgi:hypothetical protein